MKRFFLTALFLFFFFVVPPTAGAAEHFTIASNVTYTVSNTNMTHAAMRIGLTNTSSQYYASEYTIHIGFSNIDNVKASDPQGPIVPIVTKEESGYTIKVLFNTPVVGIDKTLPFTIEFDTPDIVQQQGSIYEVDIPGIANQNDFSQFNVTVSVPNYFGEPTYIKPKTASNDLSFSKEELGEGGVSIGFGESALYAFTLTYHLGNKNVFPIRTEMALPPDTTYQTVSIEDISPKPTNVTQDVDGNWLAQYSLYPSEKKTITVKGTVAVNLQPKEKIETEQTLRKYLIQQPYWEITHADIKKLADELKTPRAIYDYVVQTLSYDFSRVTDEKERLGALRVLKNPKSAVCLEFTDLFVAIARAAGIPAREVDGFAYAKNPKERPISVESDILHAWPQYYDREKKTWVMVDPTWGNTTEGVDYFDVFDFNHIAFVVKGIDSEYPVPAGGYKLIGDTAIKQVVVTAINRKELPKPKAFASIQVDEKIFAGISFGGNIRVENPNGVLYPEQTIQVKGSSIQATRQEVISRIIPPFGHVDVPIQFEKTPFWTRKNATITALISGSSVYQTVEIIPIYLALFEKPLLPWTIGGGVFIACISIIIWLITRRTRHLSVS